MRSVFGAILISLLFSVIVPVQAAETAAPKPAVTPEAEKFTQKSLEGTWKGTWITPATGFTFILELKIDAKGNIIGTYRQPNSKTGTPGLTGSLVLADAEKGLVTGKIIFAGQVVFIATEKVAIARTPGAADPFKLVGLFITKAFPGDMGKDMLEVTGGPATETKE